MFTRSRVALMTAPTALADDVGAFVASLLEDSRFKCTTQHATSSVCLFQYNKEGEIVRPPLPFAKPNNS